MTDKIEKRRQPLQCRTMARITTIMSMVRASAAMTAAWRQRRHELCRELQRITSKRVTHMRRCSSTTTQTIWGSSSYITNLDGEVVQHIEYVPFGEVLYSESESYSYMNNRGQRVMETLSKEEAATVGLNHVKKNDITENDIRKDQELNPRGAY